MSKAQVNLIRQLRRLLGNVHADVNNLELQKSFSQLGKFRILNNETETLYSNYVDYIKAAYGTKPYDTIQIQNKLDNFLTRYANSNPAPSKEQIKDFIDNTLLKPDRIIFLFRLINFDFQTEINIDDLILIIRGREFLTKLSKDNPKRKIINKNDVLLGISVIGDLNEKSYTVAYTKARRFADFISFINENSCEVEELRTHQYSNDNILGFLQNGQWNLEKVIDNSDDPEELCKLNIKKEFDNRWIPIIKESVYPELCPNLSEMRRQAIQSIDWIGKSLLVGDHTESFILLMIALETLIEQDPDELGKKVESDFPGLELNYSIEEQMTSIMDLLSVPNNTKDDANKSIKRAYGLRSKIIHNGIQLFDNNGDWAYMLSMLNAHLFTMITTIIFEDNWETKYDLWKEANHILNVKSN